ncbi:DUF3515 domain-containing protein [Leifsonia sp. H3M29-4]|uniref:DUF3515 domain-containing protein n=1 Tax=Salinibacterium metalliresistens TaxID=3031321 RepID=UPI0023DB8F0D|nr:DUF3515 domain-containing protein [Salinibacterium metalliresistens]MDF1479363.1 DUF3515 domain-containing protein [Salinibacterium metalliresistens]
MRRLALLLPLLLLAGCTPIVSLQPADDAISPACADVIVHLPDSVDDLGKRETNAQGTSAWGEPVGVILRCGVPAPAPTSELRCLTFDGVDWLIDDIADPVLVATTYGREPAIEVIIDDRADGVVLTDLANAVSYLPKVGGCLAIEDVTG